MNNAGSTVAAIATEAPSLGRLRQGCRGTVCESQVQPAFLPGGSIRSIMCRLLLHYCEVQIRMLRNHGASAVLHWGSILPLASRQDPAGSDPVRTSASKRLPHRLEPLQPLRLYLKDRPVSARFSPEPILRVLRL